MTVQGSVALVTGANGGIGQAFARALVQRGAAKVYLAARDTAALAGLLAESDRFVAVQLDVTDAAQVAAVARQAADVTLLVNNAGVATFTGALSTDTTANARREMEVNYFAPLALSQALRDTPAFRQGGAVVNVLSMLSHVTLPAAGTYSASKAAALALTRTLRAELQGRGVQVLAVMPVQVDTAMGAALPEPRLTPEVVATDTLDAIDAGIDDVYPGELTRQVAEAFRADPGAVQAQLSGMVHAI
jgi:short-subunit dehydrogenase